MKENLKNDKIIVRYEQLCKYLSPVWKVDYYPNASSGYTLTDRYIKNANFRAIKLKTPYFGEPKYPKTLFVEGGKLKVNLHEVMLLDENMFSNLIMYIDDLCKADETLNELITKNN